jgi:hypothetical protein
MVVGEELHFACMGWIDQSLVGETQLQSEGALVAARGMWVLDASWSLVLAEVGVQLMDMNLGRCCLGSQMLKKSFKKVTIQLEDCAFCPVEDEREISGLPLLSCFLGSSLTLSSFEFLLICGALIMLLVWSYPDDSRERPSRDTFVSFALLTPVDARLELFESFWARFGSFSFYLWEI